MTRSTPHRVAVAVAFASLLGATACSDTETDGADAALAPGTLITERTLTTAAALPSAARTELITYTSEGTDGRPILVSGTVAVPEGEAPDGGWPVISWAHGTTGVGDACAPSADTVGGPAHGYLGLTTAMLDRWVADGYVVVQTDYEGLGTPGGHPYMNGDSAANTVVDIVRAARELDPTVGEEWIAMGHSQGGHAALYTAATGAERAPELDLQAVVSFAPGSRTSETAEFYATGGPAIAPALGFLPVLLLGAEAADPSLSADAMLTDASRPLLTAARTGCMDDIREAAATVPVDQVFSPDANLTALRDYYATQEVEPLTPTVPTMIVQGDKDVLVGRPITDQVADALCANGADLTYTVYDDADHRAVLDESFDDVRAYVDSVRGGEEPATTCG
ncbi:MAG: alpha/beta hydrolase [Rhodococcus sp.]|uniref:alpha/beta hydrolase family protein n=1 Tax=Rhodococcus sp. TaxID=1831 RepID=UPI0016A3E4F2|nr:lipase family protein [Rhodococcus sp. (in: high G+C Gram-positive bacteria)]NLV81308.1 alpha/beta hydrolase [Rhodococcus sp. (in: high G+C Gram-positive bacteria)]